MLNKPTLVNLVLFLERTPVTGKEALAWAETYQAVGNELAALEAPKGELPKMVAP